MHKILSLVLSFVFVLSFGQKTPTIFLVGDSTMANKVNPEQNPEHGWGQVLPEYFTSDIRILNYAVNGRSTKSFIDEGKWNEVVEQVKKGDYVIIQFGHNDQKKEDPKRYTNPSTTYKLNLTRFIQEVKAKKARPILMTSIARRNFNENGVLVDSHVLYPIIVEQVATRHQVPFVDMYSISELMELEYGVDSSRLLHLHFKEGEHPYYPNGKKDDTHLSYLGAQHLAKAAAKELQQLNIGLEKYIK